MATPKCNACESVSTVPHCPHPHPTCTWWVCRDCEAVSGPVNGKPQYYVVPVRPA